MAEITCSANESALTFQIMHLHRLYMEYLQNAKLAQLLGGEGTTAPVRHRTYSSSSAGSAAATANPLYVSQQKGASASSSKLHLTSSTPSMSGNAATLAGLSGLNVPVGGAGYMHDQDSVDESSIAAKGLNIAFSFVSELLK
jgi:hypothetical protein